MAREHGQVIEETAGERDPEREARRLVALAQIRQYPDPALRMEAREVREFGDDLWHLAERMALLMIDANGVGLAATQVGVLRRVFVFTKGKDEEATAVVNPVLVQTGEEREADDEGCLSLQGVLVPVDRPAAVTLEGMSTIGEPIRLELDGIDARVVQHEIDHLDGVLIIDRTTDDARREALATLRPRPVLGVRP